uniref:LsmAD domain-containing protein n=2 Tax=Parascaris univalens TaxID=6257 RepID=A0A915C1M9_PARUN
MPHKIQQEVRGVHANPVLLSFFNDTIGREVIVETRDGQKYEGIFAACSPDFEVGLRFAHALPSGEVKKLLPHRNEIVEKLRFDAGDVLCMSVVMHEEKRIKGFATDQEYHGTRNGLLDDSLELSNEFEVWEADGEDGVDLDEAASMKSGGRSGRLIGADGWSVDEMFNANNALGVKSTFEDNLSQYTTANVEGDGEARLRAERIAQEIETNPASRMRARMENDDEERDLNKETPEFQMHTHRRTQNTASRSSYAGSARGGGNTGSGSNRAGSQASTRRSDPQSSIGRAGRGSSYGTGSNTSRSFTNSSLSHGGKGSGGSLSTYSSTPIRYQPPTERPSAQAVHNEFGQWSEMRRGESGTTLGGGGGGVQKSNGPRRSEQQAPPSAKVYEPSHRGTQQHRAGAHSPMNRSADEARSSNHSGSPHGAGSSPLGGVGKSSISGSATSGSVLKGSQTERVKGLREFHHNFNSTYQASSVLSQHASSHSPDEAQVAPRPVNAWNKGPPASIRSAACSQSPSVHQPSNGTSMKEMTPVECAIQSSEHSRTMPKLKTSPPPQSSAPHSAQGSQTCASPSVSLDTSSSSTLADVAMHAIPSTVSLDVTGSSELPSASSMTSAPTGVQPTQVTTTATPLTSPPGGLSGTASSSSIAPTDPTPSTTTVTRDHSSTNTPLTSTTVKKFEFNPDAQPFTPRSVAVHTPTPQSTPAPQPLLAAHATPVQMHGIAVNAPQAIPVAQGIQPASMMTHAGPPQMFPYAASASVYGTLPVYYGTTQAMMQTGPQLAQGVASSPAAANVAGGALVAGTGVVSAPRSAGQLGIGTPTGRRPQQQQIVQGGGVYVPGQAMPYPQQMIPAHYQVPFYTTAPYQQISVASASVPPPSVPPPTSSAVAVGATPPQPFQVIQAQTQHQQAAYSRQLYQSGQPLNYMVATAGPRYAQPHQTIEYPGGIQQCSQQPSSAGSSNGNSSNGHNSQPATPGPQPIASPAQQFPLFPGQATGSYVVYSAAHQQMMQVHPSAVTSPQVPLSQAHNPLHHHQHLPMEHYQTSGGESHQQGQGIQAHNSMPTQPYIASEQQYGQFVHAQQQVIYQQQQAALVRQNSLGAVGGPPNGQQPYQSNLTNALTQPIGGNS